MTTANQPLNNQGPQDGDEFNSAFDEYAGGDDTGNLDDGTSAEPDNQEGGTSTSREQELEAQLERLRHSESSQRGRLGAYQRQINDLQRQMSERQQAEQQQQPQQPTGEGDAQQRQDMAEAMGSDDWQTFAEDFPDMARALEARLQSDRKERAQLEQRLASYEPALQSIQQQAQEQHLQVQEDALAARHPGWREVVAAPEFAEWLNQQPESLQRLTSSDDAAEAAALLDMYQAQHGDGYAGGRTGTPDRRQQRLAAAQSVGRRGAPRQSQASDDFDAAFDHYAAKSGNR